MEKLILNEEIKKVDLSDFRDCIIPTPLLNLKVILKEAEDLGATGFYFELVVGESYLEESDLIFIKSRPETDEEFEQRKAAHERNEQWKKQLQQKFEQEEKAQYLRLKAKYENGKESN
jgi:hypothetical protein